MDIGQRSLGERIAPVVGLIELDRLIDGAHIGPRDERLDVSGLPRPSGRVEFIARRNAAVATSIVTSLRSIITPQAGSG